MHSLGVDLERGPPAFRRPANRPALMRCQGNGPRRGKTNLGSSTGNNVTIIIHDRGTENAIVNAPLTPILPFSPPGFAF